MPSQILAVSGVLGDGRRSRRLISYAASPAGSPGGRDGRTRLCFVPTAEGDSPLVLDWFNDASGNDPGILPECWQAGVVMVGQLARLGPRG